MRGIRSFPRVQAVLIPVLREVLGDKAEISSWVPDIDYRKYPVVNIRRIGGYRNRNTPAWLDHPVVEITVFSDEGLIEAEELYTEVLNALFNAADQQEMHGGGYVSYVKETMGMTQFSSPFQDTWRIQGLVQIGIRVPVEGG